MFTDKCERQNCNHEPSDHPNDGQCLKCDSVGFFRNIQVTDSLHQQYIQSAIDIKTRLNGILDMALHLNEDFPIMAKNFFDSRKKEDDEFWNNLYKNDNKTWIETNNAISQYSKIGRTALNGLSQNALLVIGKLMLHGANYQLSLGFLEEMILSYVIVMFRNFIKDISKIMFERDSKSKELWKQLNEDEKERKVRLLAENHIRDIASELKKNFGLNLKQESNFDEFAECFYRRDMYTHNEGFTNKTYRDRTNYTGTDVKLSLDKDYLNKSINLLKKYAEIIEEHCLEHYMYVVNVTKKGNVHHIDLTNGGGEIIPIKDNEESK